MVTDDDPTSGVGPPGARSALARYVAGWLLAGALLAGLLVAVLARLINRVGARSRARAAARALRSSVEDVARDLVLAPVENEIAARARLCEAVATARGRRR